MSDNEAIAVETDGETYADIRVDGAVAASVDVVDEDQVKAKLYELVNPGDRDAIDVWFIDRLTEESDEDE